jgi:predicted TIM-barrel fold metal-dependent hydrolase
MTAMTQPRYVDAILPVTPADAVKDPNELPADLRTPSILNPISPTELIERMDQYGISQSIIPARKYGPRWGVSYESLRDYVAEYPQRLFATAGICPLSRMDGVRQFEESVRDYGFIGAHAYTSWSGVPINDRLYYPYYAKAEELGVPVQLEIMGGKTRRSYGRPEFLDQVASDFPDLNLVAAHTGYPWERELVGVSEFRSNVYIGMDTLMPNAWCGELLDFIKGTGYAGFALDRFAVFADVLRTSDRSIFGTNYLSMDIDTLFGEIDDLGLEPPIKAKLMTNNARRLWGLPEVD